MTGLKPRSNALRYSGVMVTQTPLSARVKSYFEEEPEVRELLAEVPLPAGVELQRIDAGEDWTGEPAMHIVLGVSQSVPLTKERVSDLRRVMQRIDNKMIDAGMPKWPFVHFVDVA